MIDRRLFRQIDWFLIALLLFISILGVVVIYSSANYLPGNYFLRQIFWIVAGLLVLFLALSLDYKILMNYSFYFYIIFIIILAGLLFFAPAISGTKGWIKLPYFQIQPSELAKIIVILLLAQLFSEYKKSHLTWAMGLLSSGIVVLPFLLIGLEPDLGTALSYIPMLLASLILAGMNRKTLIFLVIFSILVSLVAWNFYLKDYQKKRLMTLVSPGQDPQGSGYHILQSKIAIGSGGLLGKGFKKGSQSQLRFLPARHTDFIFSVIGEELGFVGVVGTLLLYFLFVTRLFRSVNKSRDRAGVYVVFMVAMMISFQFFINVLMIIGIFPIAGVPLPLMSYGGSSLLANYLGVALVLNVKMRRFVNI
jgi:rod shape determining protein RodA